MKIELYKSKGSISKIETTKLSFVTFLRQLHESYIVPGGPLAKVAKLLPPFGDPQNPLHRQLRLQVCQEGGEGGRGDVEDIGGR